MRKIILILNHFFTKILLSFNSIPDKDIVYKGIIRSERFFDVHKIVINSLRFDLEFLTSFLNTKLIELIINEYKKKFFQGFKLTLVFNSNIGNEDVSIKIALPLIYDIESKDFLKDIRSAYIDLLDQYDKNNSDACFILVTIDIYIFFIDDTFRNK